jgi:zinc transport system substrate-binding protein
MIGRNKNITHLNCNPGNTLCIMLSITELIAIILLTIFFGRPTLAADPLPVFVSINPQKYFVQQIGKELVNVQVMVLPGTDPHTYAPRPRQMAELSKTQVYFAIGVPFEHIWLKKLGAANPEMKIVHTDGGIAKIPMATHHHN